MITVTRLLKFLLVVLLLGGFPWVAFAAMTSDHFAIPSSGIISGGGGVSSAGFSVQSAVGQGMPVGLTGGDGEPYIVGSGFFFTVPSSLDDVDADTILSLFDNCPSAANIDQADTNDNGLGDACDVDSDTDGDGLSDAEEYVFGTNPNSSDSDGDGVEDLVDNCRLTQNLNQTDSSGDGFGDACDTVSDSDSDGLTDVEEFECGSDPLDDESVCSKGMPWLLLLLDEEE